MNPKSPLYNFEILVVPHVSMSEGYKQILCHTKKDLKSVCMSVYMQTCIAGRFWSVVFSLLPIVLIIFNIVGKCDSHDCVFSFGYCENKATRLWLSYKCVHCKIVNNKYYYSLITSFPFNRNQCNNNIFS